MGFLKLLKELVQRVEEHDDTVMDTNEECNQYNHYFMSCSIIILSMGFMF